MVVSQKAVPLAAPDDLDYIPTGSAEEGFKLLDDLAVASNRTVKALKVRVDNEGQVI